MANRNIRIKLKNGELWDVCFPETNSDVVLITSDGNKSLTVKIAEMLNAISLLAPKASPALTGTPTAPTATAGTNTTQLATTAFVQSAVSALVNTAPAALDTLKELATALGNDANFATTMTNLLAQKAPLASPTFTGVPSAPTAPHNTNTSQLATTAFVQQEIDALASNLITVSTTAPTDTNIWYEEIV